MPLDEISKSEIDRAVNEEIDKLKAILDDPKAKPADVVAWYNKAVAPRRATHRHLGKAIKELAAQRSL